MLSFKCDNWCMIQGRGWIATMQTTLAERSNIIILDTILIDSHEYTVTGIGKTTSFYFDEIQSLSILVLGERKDI